MKKQAAIQATITCPNCGEHEQTLSVPGITKVGCTNPDGEPPPRLRVTPFVFKAWVADVITDEDCECACGKRHHTNSTSEAHPVYGLKRPSKKKLLREMESHFVLAHRIGDIRPACQGDFNRWLEDGTTAENVWMLEESTWFLFEVDGMWETTFEPTAQQTNDMLTGKLKVWRMTFAGGL